jgi:hypothetical protein
MRPPDEPRADGELPLPPRPVGEVVVPPLRASELRRELRRLESERESAQLELGGLVAEMARQGALAPALLADGAAMVRSRQDQIDAIASALGDRGPIAAAGASSRRATVLAALLAVGILGAVAGAWIERRHNDGSAAPVTALSIVTETVTTAAVPATVTTVAITAGTTRSHVLALRARGGHAIARGR